MNLAVTISAASIEEEHRIASPWSRRVPTHVALGAQPRVGDFQQPIVNGAVRLMAVCAIFERGRMLIEERPSSFGMAGVAVFVDAGLLEL